LKKFLITLLKILVSAAIIAYLFVDAVKTKNGKNVFGMMLQEPKQWDFLAAAWLCTGVAVVLTLIRWCYLVRATGIAFRMQDAMRIGFLGYLFNLAPMGIVGGDLLKAVMLAREYHGFRAKALASVIIDRVVGLYVLFLVASAGILLTGFYWRPIPGVHLICQITLALTVVGTIGVAIVLFSNVLEGAWLKRLTNLPRIGAALGSLIEALHIYRRDRAVLLSASVMTVGVHCLLTVAIYLIARGLPGKDLPPPPPLSTQFVIYPISSVASTVPLPAGPFEAVFVSLYTHVDVAGDLAEGQALIIALVFRLINVLLAVVGFGYYLGARREVAAVMHEVEEQAEEPGENPSPCCQPAVKP
jgi:uncharacterized protein (TIRG00374 family)